MSKQPKVKKAKVEKADAPGQRERYNTVRVKYDEIDALHAPPPLTQKNKFDAKDSPATRQIILNWLAAGYSYTRAANEAGTTRFSVIAWRDKDEAFNQACKDAIEQGTDYFEDEARRRAVNGVDRPIFQGGVLVGHERQYSDALLQMQMKGRRPERYNDKVEVGGPGGGPIQHSIEVAFVQPGDKKK